MNRNDNGRGGTALGPQITNRRLRWGQVLTVILLVTGYAGFYICRSNFSVTLPLIIDDLTAHGIPAAEARVRLGLIASLGMLAYALGKFFLGGLADFWGGRRQFLAAMGGAILCTLAAASGALPVFALAWVGNRLIQSAAWAGLVKITSRWFSFATYGTVMGVMSLSFLFGDAIGRDFMGVLIAHGLGWRSVFVVAAFSLFALFLANLLLLKESSTEIGEPEPTVNPDNLFASSEDKKRPPGVSALLGPLFRSPAFWIVCALSLGTTFVRETFNIWTPTYFYEVVHFSQADSARFSALFPLFGGFSVLLFGYLSDRLGRGGRAMITFAGLLFATLTLFLLASLRPSGPRNLPVALVALAGFVIVGPYSYLAGAMALDFGGKHGAATSSGIIDGVGYLGGVLSGDAVARISLAAGWQGAFVVLGVVTAFSTLAAAFFFVLQRRPAVPAGDALGAS
jgi:OPA family glycerol-3-phosphate transporter-like MFS transporter